MEKEAPKNDQNEDLYHIMAAQGIKIAIGMKQQLAGKRDPKILSDIILSIIERVESEGRSHGLDFPLQVVKAAGETISMVVFIVAGISESEQDLQLVKQVIGIVVGKYMEKGRQSGRITNEQIQVLAQELQQGQSSETAPEQSDMGE